MFPWNPDDLGKIVVGRPLLPIFQEMASKQTGVKIGRSILEKLGAGQTNFYPKTIRQHNLDFPVEVIRSEAFQRIHETKRLYRQFFDLATELMQVFAKDTRAVPVNLFHQSLRDLFPQTIGAILWAEDYWISCCERGASMKIKDPDGPTASFSTEVLDAMPKSLSDAEKRFRVGLLLEHHFFMFYFAAFELDMEKVSAEAEFMVPCPTLFAPTQGKHTAHYPMWSFWKWFCEKADCRTWAELAEKADFNKSDSPDGAEGEQVVRNWANAKPKPEEPTASNCRMISWKRLRQALSRLEGTSDPWSAYQLEIQWGYGLSRILQEHAARCLPTLLNLCSPKLSLEKLYLERIELCKQNECRLITALVA